MKEADRALSTKGRRKNRYLLWIYVFEALKLSHRQYPLPPLHLQIKLARLKHATYF